MEKKRKKKKSFAEKHIIAGTTERAVKELRLDVEDKEFAQRCGKSWAPPDNADTPAFRCYSAH